MVITPMDAVPPLAIVQHLFDDGFLCAVRNGHPRVKKKMTLSLYTQIPHIQIAPRGTSGGPVDRALEARGLSRRVLVRTPSFFSAPLLASRSDLLLNAPSMVLLPIAPSIGLRTFALPLSVPGFRMGQAWHPRVSDDPAHKWLRALIAEATRNNRPGAIAR